MKYFYVYKTTNLLDGKSYIGKHVSKKETDSYLGSGLLLNRAIKKYGQENFKRIILEYCENNTLLCEREINWIEKENTFFPNGYNIAKGGFGGDTTSNHPDKDSISKKRSIIQKKKFEENEEWKNKLSKSRLGKKHTDESKNKISHSRLGMKFTQSHVNNMREASKKAWEKMEPYNARKIDVFDLKNNYINSFDSIADTARYYSIRTQGIWSCCKGINKKYKGYIFKYKN